LCFAFMAGMAYSQNESTVTQLGQVNNASVTQTGSNKATVLQETLLGATNNNATVLQNGTGNTSFSDQLQQAGKAAPQNISVTQIGNENGAIQLQGFGYTGYNDAIISQKSSENTGFQQQDGYNLTATINQSGGNGNTGGQNQNGAYLNARIDQLGASNFGDQKQSGINNSATISQTGDGNIAGQKQAGGTYNSPPVYLSGHISSISQIGSGNFANQTVEGTENNITSIVQEGIGNFSTHNVNGSSNISKLYQTKGGYATLSQIGVMNVVKGLTSVGAYDGSWAKFSGKTLNIDQTGFKNIVSLEADGIADITQFNNGSPSPKGNTIEFSQSGGGIASIAQVGDANLIKLIQTAKGTANIVQTGNENKVAQFDDVFGAANVTSAALFNGASLDVNQTGDGNLFNLNSTSADANVSVSQLGNTNHASVIQN